MIWGGDGEDDASDLPPVSPEEETSQLQLLRSGQVPTIFWGRAYTNNALNGVGVLKFKDLVEEMFYSLLYETSSHPTVELLLRLCWLPRPRPHSVYRMYTNLPHAEQARGPYIDEVRREAVSTEPRPAAASEMTGPPWRRRRRRVPTQPPADSDADRLDGLAAPRGLDILMASMLRISRMLLGLCIGDHDAGDSGRERMLAHLEERISAFRGGVAAPRLPSQLPLLDVQDGLPEAVRDTINRLSEQWSLLTQALSPSSMPLGLAMLFCRSLPSSAFKLKAAPSDVAALEQFRLSELGRAFVKLYEAEFGPSPDVTPQSKAAQRDRLAKELLAGALGVPEDDISSLVSSEPDASAASSMNESLATSGFGRLPLFYVPGVKLILPVQGHAVQFWPLFLSRLQLVTVLKEVHKAVAQLWGARRRAERDAVCSAVQAGVMRAFQGPGGAATPSVSSFAARQVAEDDEDSDEPPELRELMEELAAESLSMAPSSGGGLLKSMELICVGTTSLLTSSYRAICNLVDSALLAMPGGLTLLGIRRSYPIHACRLHEYLTVAQGWNAAEATTAEALMSRRHAALEREMQLLLQELTGAVERGEAASLAPSSTDRDPTMPAAATYSDRDGLRDGGASTSREEPPDEMQAMSERATSGVDVGQSARQVVRGDDAFGRADSGGRSPFDVSCWMSGGGALTSAAEDVALDELVRSGSLRTSGTGVELRMAELLQHAAQEWNILVQNLLVAQRRSRASDAAMLRLREEERRSRLRLMQSLIAIGDDLSHVPGIESSSGLRATWLTVVNSLLTMDQAAKLAPLMEHSPMHKICIERFKAVSGTLESIINVGSALWWHATQDDRVVGALVSPIMRQLAARGGRRADRGGLSAATGPQGRRGAASESANDGDALPRNIWRINLDLLGGAAARSDPDMSVAIEIDSAEVLGDVDHDMLMPRDLLPRQCNMPEFRGLLLVGDLVQSSDRLQLQGHPVNFGYLA